MGVDNVARLSWADERLKLFCDKNEVSRFLNLTFNVSSQVDLEMQGEVICIIVLPASLCDKPNHGYIASKSTSTSQVLQGPSQIHLPSSVCYL